MAKRTLARKNRRQRRTKRRVVRGGGNGIGVMIPLYTGEGYSINFTDKGKEEVWDTTVDLWIERLDPSHTKIEPVEASEVWNVLFPDDMYYPEPWHYYKSTAIENVWGIVDQDSTKRYNKIKVYYSKIYCELLKRGKETEANKFLDMYVRLDGGYFTVDVIKKKVGVTKKNWTDKCYDRPTTTLNPLTLTETNQI
jgi:hypothetical protein